jgi:hypothetical protein
MFIPITHPRDDPPDRARGPRPFHDRFCRLLGCRRHKIAVDAEELGKRLQRAGHRPEPRQWLRRIRQKRVRLDGRQPQYIEQLKIARQHIGAQRSQRRS